MTTNGAVQPSCCVAFVCESGVVILQGLTANGQQRAFALRVMKK